MDYPTDITEAHIAAANELLDELSRRYEFSIALISGSLAFGLGHGTSDVDLYVRTVGDEPIEDRPYRRGGYSVQVNVITGAKLAEAVSWAGDDSEFTSTNRHMLGVQENVRKFAIRLTRGHVLHLDDEGRAILERLDVNVIRRRQIARQANVTGIHLEDVAGALTSGDIDTAFCAARIALAHACEGALAACDDLYVGPKFLFRRLRRAHQLRQVLPQLLTQFNVPWAADPVVVSDEDSVVAAIETQARLASYITSHAVLDGWDGKLEPLAPMRLGTAGPVRDAYHCLMRFGDGIALTGPDKGYRVSADAARLWLSLDGTRTVSEIGPDDQHPAVSGIRQLHKLGAVIGGVE
ncbi:MAG TPA: hypothetical protein VM677_02565 [Actinokineospora sp.]|jgi:hypothetical protein|nr:hypothetical protein [Actinokineospora sp.]